MLNCSNIKVCDLSLNNIDDIIYVCSQEKIKNPEHLKGIKMKKNWIKNMLKQHSKIGKIAYLNDKPVGQIIYYPHHFDPLYWGLNGKAMIIHCIYCPFEWAQRKGVGTILLNSVIGEAKKQGCDFTIVNAFDTGEFLPMPKFYMKRGFKKMQDLKDHYYLSLSNKEPKLKPMECKRTSEDKNKAIVFYSCVCQFFYPFTLKIKKIILEVLPNYSVEVVNYWENPDLFLSKGKNWILVNGIPIKTWVREEEKFRQEVLAASQQE